MTATSAVKAASVALPIVRALSSSIRPSVRRRLLSSDRGSTFDGLEPSFVTQPVGRSVGAIREPEEEVAALSVGRSVAGDDASSSRPDWISSSDDGAKEGGIL